MIKNNKIEKDLVFLQKFNFYLKSRTNKKRLKEVLPFLKGVYPFPVVEKNIFIVKTCRKNFFDVYILKNEFKKKMRVIRIIFLFVCLLLVILSFVFLYRSITNRKKIFYEKQKEKIEKEVLEKNIQKEKILKLDNLQKEYEAFFKEKYEKIFPMLECIYQALKDDSSVESLSIQKNNFSVEIITKNATKILKNFEKSKSLSFVKMNRTTVKGKDEIVIYNGSFSEASVKAVESYSLDEKIIFYENELQKIYTLNEKMRKTLLSDYIANLRDVFQKNNCEEQYIQVYQNEKNVEVEFFVQGESKSILSFLRQVQSGEDNLVHIKKMQIKNSEKKMQMTIRFWTGIEIKKDEDVFFEKGEMLIDGMNKNQVSLSDINKIFYKKPVQKNDKKIKEKIIETKKIVPTFENSSLNNLKNNSRAMKKILFIGVTKMNGKTFVIAKDENTGSIYKLLLQENEASENCCVQNGNTYIAKIRNEYYEVKK